MTLLKALPLSYNRDLQEDKTFLFEGLDTVLSSVKLMHLMLEGAQFRKERMENSLAQDFSNATDLADYLVPTRGSTFRQSHGVVGQVVRACIEKGVGLEDMTLSDLQIHSPLIQSDVVAILKHQRVMAARILRGTSPSAVSVQISAAKEKLDRTFKKIFEIDPGRWFTQILSHKIFGSGCLLRQDSLVMNRCRKFRVLRDLFRCLTSLQLLD